QLQQTIISAMNKQAASVSEEICNGLQKKQSVVPSSPGNSLLGFPPQTNLKLGGSVGTRPTNGQNERARPIYGQCENIRPASG
ncbi:hypothetical protein, partial [Klebsiella pneumoniae]|uniref:hypothetical protein n=1 Tax=Klebsiella pneumoniae TaxID=573 RepID=UPI001BDFF679